MWRWFRMHVNRDDLLTTNVLTYVWEIRIFNLSLESVYCELIFLLSFVSSSEWFEADHNVLFPDPCLLSAHQLSIPFCNKRNIVIKKAQSYDLSLVYARISASDNKCGFMFLPEHLNSLYVVVSDGRMRVVHPAPRFVQRNACSDAVCRVELGRIQWFGDVPPAKLKQLMK